MLEPGEPIVKTACHHANGGLMIGVRIFYIVQVTLDQVWKHFSEPVAMVQECQMMPDRCVPKIVPITESFCVKVFFEELSKFFL
jgi:hypothetical protein